MVPIDIASLPVPALAAVMAAAATLVWIAGTKITHYVDAIARRTGIGEAFAGMLLLGGVTSLPELATAGTAAASGDALLTVNDLLGSASMNLMLLAVGDFVYGRDALTSVAGRPVTLMQGTLGMMLLAAVGFAIATGDVVIPLIGAGLATLILALACIQALRISRRFVDNSNWKIANLRTIEPIETPEITLSNSRLGVMAGIAALGVLGGGGALAMSGSAIAEKTGIGSSIVGFLLVGFATSLPELSSVLAALRLRRYQMAIGDIFGTNLFNIQILFVADLVYRDGALLNAAGSFEIAASCLAALLTGLFLVGLLERNNRTIGRVGFDSAAVLVLFAGGIGALATI